MSSIQGQSIAQSQSSTPDLPVTLWGMTWKRQGDGSLRRPDSTVDFNASYAVIAATVYRLSGERDLRMLEAHARAAGQADEELAAWLYNEHQIVIEASQHGYGLYWESGTGQRLYRGAGKTLSAAVLDWAHRQ